MENVSTYLQFKHSEMTEWEFMTEVTRRSGCDILLDVNNIYVNAMNHDFDPKKYIDGLPLDRVKQIHLAGHSDMGDYLFDTHSQMVCPEVWELFQYVAPKLPEDTPFMIEWDDQIPEFHRLEEEALTARDHWKWARGALL